ncbi:hypothetical protein MOMA_08491 [Moraxella macacae 0408225]|uniref:Uncharacterized protein n=1 Tax=Moraxella macacae 0408225 TaxID=1230338 RepID=L2F760_9GAMM|nr:hypothetical protein [Moraxella macacae]ELA08586.1 hypothetical protein MOMA_08491 [Moraxella macacae 0408225]
MLPNNLEELSDHELQRLEKMLDIAKLNLDIEESRQRMEESRKRFDKDMEESRATIEQMKANTEKIAKEARFYPYITITTALIAGLMGALITKLL